MVTAEDLLHGVQWAGADVAKDDAHRRQSGRCQTRTRALFCILGAHFPSVKSARNAIARLFLALAAGRAG